MVEDVKAQRGGRGLPTLIQTVSGGPLGHAQACQTAKPRFLLAVRYCCISQDELCLLHLTGSSEILGAQQSSVYFLFSVHIRCGPAVVVAQELRMTKALSQHTSLLFLFNWPVSHLAMSNLKLRLEEQCCPRGTRRRGG